MTFSITHSLLLLLVLAFGSLLMVGLANERQRRKRQQRLRLNALRQRVERLEELVIDVDQMLEDRAIARLLNEEILELVETMRTLEPQTSYLEALRQTALARADTLLDGDSPHSLDRLRESDAQIARARRNLEDAATEIRRLYTRERISQAEYNTFVTQLRWSDLMVAVLSHVGQGHKARQREDLPTAHAFYRRAQQLLTQAPHSDPRRQRMIKELGEILDNKRRSLSPDLMPETHANPPS